VQQGERRYCRQPDHDNARLVCGYPLPCPWHTAIVDLGASPPTVTVPTTANLSARTWAMLNTVAQLMGEALPAARKPKRARKRSRR
jgi:hypothetical protein